MSHLQQIAPDADEATRAPGTAAQIRVSPAWLELREAGDAAARSPDLVEPIRRHLPACGRAVIHDLGCGTGSMGRWLAPRLTGTQHWVVYDRDADLLDHAGAEIPGRAADGAAVTVETRCRDVTRLDPGDLAGASLITVSALIDLLTADELERLIMSCAGACCPVLVTISVTGRVDLTPADPLDERIAGAFNDHQRRAAGGRRLLGPDAVVAAADAFTRLGRDVRMRPSPWRLGAAQGALVGQWLTDWVGAACEQRPELAAAAPAYLRRRLAEASAGRLSVTVHHLDLLARPR